MNGPTDGEIARAILSLAEARAPRTLCPSEVARGLRGDWRPLMARVRAVAAGMAAIEATQAGAPVDPQEARGPIRLGLRG